MPITNLPKRYFMDPLLKAISPWPQGLGAGVRGGKVLASKTGNIRYAPRTMVRVPTKGAPEEWTHAIRSVMPKAGGVGLQQTAHVASQTLPKVQAHEFLRGFHVKHGDYHSRLVRLDGFGPRRGMQSHLLAVKGHVYHTPTGKMVGEFHREFERTPSGRLVAHHGIFQMHPQHQGSGFGTHFYKQVEHTYRNAGVDEVRMRANYKVGPYVWAMNGFDFSNRDDRQNVLNNYNDFLKQRGQPAFRRRHDIPFHDRSHALHPWEIATHEVNGQRLGKEFLTSGGEHAGYDAVKHFDGGEGVKVGLAYQRSHAMTRQNIQRDFAKAGPVEEDVPSQHDMNRHDAEGLERHMEPWHEDDAGEATAHRAVVNIIDDAHGTRPKTVVTDGITDTVTPPDLAKANIWRSSGEWFVNAEWLLKSQAEPFGLFKAVLPVQPIRPAGNQMIANKPTMPPQPKLSRQAGPPSLKRPSLPEHAGQTLSSKNVPRTPEGKIDWMSVQPGSSFWVTIHDPESPLEGRAVRIVKRGANAFAAAGGSFNVGKIMRTTSPAMQGQFKREEKMLGESAEHMRRMPEVADTRKMSTKDIRAAATMHRELPIGRKKSPEEEAAREKARTVGSSPAARGARQTYNQTRRSAEKLIRRLHVDMMKAIGVEHDEKGNPTHLTKEELTERQSAISRFLGSRKFKKFNPYIQDLIANTMNNEVTRLDNYLRQQEKMAAEAEVAKANKFSNDVSLPVDIGLAGVDLPDKKSGLSHKEGSKGRHLVITPSTQDNIADIADQVQRGTMPAELGEEAIKEAIDADLKKNVDAAQAAENPDTATDDQKAAKDELEKAAKDPDAVLVQHGRERKSVHRQMAAKLARESLLKNPYVVDRMERVAQLRQEMAKAAGRDKEAGALFQDALATGDISPWASAAQQNVQQLSDAISLIATRKNGDVLDPAVRTEIRQGMRAQTIDPAIRDKVFAQLGKDFNSRRLSSIFGAEILPLKYGGIESYGALNEQNPTLSDVEPPNVEGMTPEKLWDAMNDPEKGVGDAVLQAGPYFQSQALKRFEEVRQTFFPDVPQLNMRGFVRLYGMQVAAHVFAHHLWKNYVLDVERTGEPPEVDLKKLNKYQKRDLRRGKLTPEKLKDLAYQRLAGERQQRWRNVMERTARDITQLNPVVERDMLRRDAEFERQWEAVQQAHDYSAKRSDEDGVHEALLQAAALTARGAMNAGSSLGSMAAASHMLDAMKNVQGDYREKNIPLTVRYGENEELARSAAKRLFRIEHEQHVENQGTSEKPQWVVHGTLAKWMDNAIPAIKLAQYEDEERNKMRSDRSRGVADENGERWASDDSLPQWIRPGGKYIKSDFSDGESTLPVRIKEDQRNALEVLHKNRTGMLDHTTGFGKSFISVLHGLNEIGHAEKEGKQHRTLIVHTHPEVWEDGPDSAWKKFVKDDAPIHIVKRGTTDLAAQQLAGLKDKSGIVIVHHADLKSDKVKQAVADAGFHTVVVDEPQTPGMMLSKKRAGGVGGYTPLAKFLYKGEGGRRPIVAGSGQNDNSGAHLVLSSATLANPDNPRAMYMQLSPLLQRAGSVFGSRRYWMKTTSNVGSVSPSAQPGTVHYVRNVLNGVQVADPKYRYAFKITPHRHRAPLTPEQHEAVRQFQGPGVLTSIRDNDLLKPPPGYRLKAGERQGGAVERDPSVNAAKFAELKKDAEHYAYIGNRTKSQYDKFAKLYTNAHYRVDAGAQADVRKVAARERDYQVWTNLLEQRRRERISEAVYGMPRSQLGMLDKPTSHGLVKRYAPVMHDFLQSLEKGNKTVGFSFGSRYLTGLTEDLMKRRLYSLHGNKEQFKVINADHHNCGHDECQTDAGRERRLAKDIAEFQALPNEHSGALIFARPLTGKSIGKADRIMMADVPRDEAGNPDAIGILQSFGRGTRNRGNRPLHTHQLEPDYVPAMNDHAASVRQVDGMVAYNPAAHSALGEIMKRSRTWLRVQGTEQPLEALPSLGVVFMKARSEKPRIASLGT